MVENEQNVVLQSADTCNTCHKCYLNISLQKALYHAKN